MKNKNTAIIIFLVAFLCIWVYFIYFNTVFLPQKLKPRLVSFLTELFKQDVEIEKLSYDPFSGLSIHRLSVYDKIKDNAHTSLEVGKISFNPLFFPLIKNRVIIPAIKITSPKIYLKRRSDKTLNLWPLPAPQGAWVKIISPKIRVRKGEIYFSDESISPNYRKEILDLNINIDVGLTMEAKLSLEAKIPNAKQLATKLDLNGTYGINQKKLKIKVRTNSIILAEYRPYLENIGLIRSFRENQNADLLESVGALKNIFFESEIADNKLNVVKASFETLNSRFNILGTVKDLRSPVVALGVSCNEIRLQDLSNLFPRIKSILEIRGLASVDMQLERAAGQPLAIKANAAIKDGRARFSFLEEPLTNIKANLRFYENALVWQNLVFDFRKQSFASAGKIISFKNPELGFSLLSHDINLNAGADVNGNTVRINSLRGNFKTASFDIKGSADISDKKNPAFNLAFDIRANPKDLAPSLPKRFANLINKFKLNGFSNLSGLVNAKSANPRSWDMSVKVSSAEFSVYGLKLENLFLDIGQANKLLHIENATAFSYNGRIKLSLISNLELADPPFSIELNAENIDLAKLKTDISRIKDEDISGLVNITADGKGTLKDLNNLKAKGKVNIREGRLWELDLFKGLSEFLFLPSFHKVIFKEGSADFQIENKTVYTSNAILKSSDMDLFGEGSIGFDGRLDLALTTQLAAELMQGSKDIRRFTTVLSGNYLLVKVDGTLEEPKYHISSIPQEAIKNIKGYFSDKQK
ncbi:MAG: AsmA-like C-terminal region-containing protein [Candidatus Omnitrophica bacterium]|nr:AsmA-like C-terminal region-containing protein [Candidatus Omnitrophota bacterium]